MKKAKLHLDFLSAAENLSKFFSKVAVLFTVKKIVTFSFVTTMPAYFPRR